MKSKFLSFTLALLVVQVSVAQTNPSSPDSQNAAAIANPSGIYVSSYDKTYHHEVTAGWTFINDNAIHWADGAGGQVVVEWVNDFWGPYDEIDKFNWPASSWPQAIPPGTGTTVINGELYWQGSCPTFDAIFLEHCGADFEMDYPDSTPAAHETFHKNAQTKLTLATGGPPGSTKMNLWVVSASATAETFIPSGGTFPDDIPDDYPIGAIPFTDISAGDFGQLDDSGHACKVLPDNTKVDVTPSVAGNDHYSFSDPPGEYTPVIRANGVTLDPDTVVNGADFCVGQHIQFEITGMPGHYDNDDVAIWTLPGTFVNERPDANCDLFYDENATLLTRHYSTDGTISTYCWYVLDGQQVTASVTLYYDFYHTGKIFTQTITGKFNVHRPTTAKGQPYQPDGPPTVMVTNGWLSLGNGRDRDMSFGHQIQTDSYCSGQAGYVQLVSGEYTRSSDGNTVYVATNNSTALDGQYGEFSRGTPSIPANTNSTVIFYDGPADGLHQGNASMDEDFSTYLMFKPSGGIWVPLRLVTWTLNDEADNDVYVKGNPVAAPSDNDCTAFPHWENEFSP